jgi:hypothetical protein
MGGDKNNMQSRLVPVAWVAGFVEGEGTFTCHQHHNNTTRGGKRVYYASYVPTFQVSQKERQPLDLIASFFESKGVRGRVWFRSNKYGGAFEYRSLGLKNGKIIFEVLQPHMHSLRKLAQMQKWIERAEAETNHPTDANIISLWPKPGEDRRHA